MKESNEMSAQSQPGYDAPEGAASANAEPSAARFLSRFVGRGWLHATRDDPSEQRAVDLGLRKRWLRRELSEVHFTPKGRIAIAEGCSCSTSR